MKLNDKGYRLIAGFEGLRLSPYYATEEEKRKGIVTLGYGNTSYPNGTKVKITDAKISEVEAFEMLKVVSDNFASKVHSLIKKDVTQNQFSALVSLAYNIGLGNFGKSTLLKLVNINPNDAMISKEFLKWNKQSGKVLNGLTNRRIKESALYYSKL
jgi:lysozyme